MSFCLYTLCPNVCTLFIQYLQLFLLEILNFFNEFLKSGIRWNLPVTNTSTDTPCPEVEHLVTTVSVTSETANSNSLLPKTASNDIQQHVYSANIDDVENVS